MQLKRLIWFLVFFIIFSSKITTAVNPKPIIIPTHNWSSQIVMAHVIGEIFKKMGFKVDYQKHDSQKVYEEIRKGNVSLSHEVWESSFGKSFNSALKKGGILDWGDHKAKAMEEMGYPNFIMELPEIKKDCREFPDWKALKNSNCAKHFIVKGYLDSGSKGRWLEGPKSWHGDLMSSRLKALDLDKLWVVKYATEINGADALWSELQTAKREKRGTIIFNWTPNFTDAEGFTFIKFPAYKKGCRIKDGGDGKCGSPLGYLKKAVHSGFVKSHPEAAEVFKKISFSTSNIGEMAAYVDVDKVSHENAAKIWLRKNKKIWQPWLAAYKIDHENNSETLSFTYDDKLRIKAELKHISEINSLGKTTSLIDKESSEIYQKNLNHWQQKEIKAILLDNSPPLVYKENEEKYSGIVIDLWNEIAKRNNLKFNFTIIAGKNKSDKSINLVASKDFDLVVAPLLITPHREKIADFSRPFYIERTGLAIKKKKGEIADIILELAGDIIIIILVLIGSFMLVFALGLRFFEKKKSKKQFQGLEGFGFAFWIAIASFLRDILYQPKTMAARVMFLFWLLLSATTVTLITSLTTSLMTYSLTISTNDIKNKAEFDRKKVAILASEADVPKQLGKSDSNIYIVNTDKEGFQAIEFKTVDAYMGTYVVLDQIIRKNPDYLQNTEYTMASYVAKFGEMGFAFPPNSSLVEIVNRTIKELQAEGFIRKVCERYLPKDKTTGCFL